MISWMIVFSHVDGIESEERDICRKEVQTGSSCSEILNYKEARRPSCPAGLKMVTFLIPDSILTTDMGPLNQRRQFEVMNYEE